MRSPRLASLCLVFLTFSGMHAEGEGGAPAGHTHDNTRDFSQKKEFQATNKEAQESLLAKIDQIQDPLKRAEFISQIVGDLNSPDDFHLNLLEKAALALSFAMSTPVGEKHVDGAKVGNYIHPYQVTFLEAPEIYKEVQRIVQKLLEGLHVNLDPLDDREADKIKRATYNNLVQLGVLAEAGEDRFGWVKSLENTGALFGMHR